MKEDLRALYLSGVKRARFLARVQLYSRAGLIALDNIQSPTGITSHVWIRQESWRGPIPLPGKWVEFTAEIRPYYKGQGDLDYGLFRAKVINYDG
jgi:hypothetical protein